ncbi:DUF2334 domain-containing protein [Massilia niastensis]|uniref:DUF2334 domain-containing protein n=1 Tax=Massilia niastensis TaxID=544911 RepID=UPI0003AA9E36|nr:polysaccharide deacetylase family protein [Massilia niastensis]
MLPTERTLCVSIHDVAPATWDECARLAEAIRAVADIPLTWLVVPAYHRAGGDAARMDAGLAAALARGDELALHGYTHLDSGPHGLGWRDGFLRGVYSREGEFAALPAEEAARRIRLGLAWFAERGWPVSGFIAPAWLLGEGAWEALRGFRFEYTTTYTRFHLLAGGVACLSPFSPALVYAARNRSGRLLSPPTASLLAAGLARAPLVRLGLHPPDLRHPHLVRHAQHLVRQLLGTRAPLTKAGFAQRLQLAVPAGARPAAGGAQALRDWRMPWR